MAVFSVVINQSLTLPITPPFTPNFRPLKRPNGEVQSVRDSWSFRGILPADSTGAPNLKTQRDAILAAFEQTSQTVEFKVDGVVFEKISPATHARGAFFENFDVEESGAEWINALVYRFTVVGERSVAIPGILENTSTIITDTRDGKTSLTLEVEARGPGSLLFVQGAELAGANLSRIQHTPKNDFARGTFTVSPEGSGNGQEITIVETITVEPGVFPTTYRFPTRSDTPIPNRSSRRPTRVRIEGVATVRPSAVLVPPLAKELADFLVRNPSISRGVKARPESIDTDDEQNNPVDEVRYSFESELPSPVSLGGIVDQRRAIEATGFVLEAGGEVPELGFAVT